MYFTYGMHYALNIVTGHAGRGEGVLIRAGEPIEGIEIMMRNRYGYKAQSMQLDVMQGNSEERVRRRKSTLRERLSVIDAAVRQELAGATSLDGWQGKALHNLSNGPGKLAQALGIRDTKLSGQKLNKSSIFLEPPARELDKGQIVIGPRVGISKAVEVDARFYIKGNPFVSGYNRRNG